MIVSKRHRRRGGFTLIELMVAMTVGMILMTALTTLFLDSLHMADVLLNQAQLNRQAREMFDLLALGGYRTKVNVKASTASGVGDSQPVDYNYIFGLRGRSVSASLTSTTSGFYPPKKFMAASGATTPVPYYRLELSPYGDQYPTDGVDESAVLLSDREVSVTVTCTASDTPVGACSGTTAAVTGYLRIEPQQETSRDILNVEPLALDLINARYYDPTQTLQVQSDVSTVYWSAFTNLVD